MSEERYKIEDNIPIPKKRSGRQGITLTGRLRELTIGQSVLAQGYTTKNIGGFLFNVRKETGGKYTARAVESGVRVWRLS